jgi:cell division protein FtsI (penicillin-binding protein 3)
MDEKKQLYIKSYVLYFAAVLVMITVIVRVVYIQYGDVVPESPVLTVNGEETQVKVDSIVPMRGRILADDGSDLVTTVPLYNLHIDLSIIKDELFKQVDSLAWNLAQVFPEKTESEWAAELRIERQRKNGYYLVQNKVKYDVVQKVREFPILRESRFKGGYIEEKLSKREMPYGSLAQRTLGYKREGAKPIGLEAGFDEYLTGQYGLMEKEWVNGSWKPIGSDYIKDPIDGADIITSINIDIQDVAENELRRQLENQSAKYGAVVVMEVQTGFVKAIANLSRNEEDGLYYESYNHAVGTKTDPGSTFKLASLMALLEDKKANITDSVNAYGEYHFYTHTTYDDHEGGYGRITLQHAFEVSSNVFSKVINDAYSKEPQRFIERIKSFGLADTLGLDIAGEPKPVVKNEGQDGWSGLTLPQMAIGYEVEITPLQTLAFYNAVANNGELIKPQFVKEIRQEGRTIVTFEKEVLREKICSDQTLEKLKVCLEGVVENPNGTGKNLKSANFRIAGKTGTAKMVNTNQGYGSEYQASFVGYFPADEPKYSAIVIIAGPTKQIYGASVSGTVFTAIANKIYSSDLEYHVNYNGGPLIATRPRVKAGYGDDAELVLEKLGVNYSNNSGNQSWVSASYEQPGVNLDPRYVNKSQVPNVIGMPLNDAVYLLENFGLRVLVSGNGRVVSQSMTPGDILIKGRTIKLELR